MAQMDTLAAETTPRPLAWGRWRIVGRGVGIGFVVVVALVASFELVYAGKVFPGVHADGAYVGGLSHTELTSEINKRTTDFAGEAVTIANGRQSTPIPVANLAVRYDTAKVTGLAYNYGRQGSLWRRLHEQARALVGRTTSFAAYQYNDDKLTPYISDITDDAVSPVTDAKLSFADNRASVAAGHTGTRVDLGALMSEIDARIAGASTTAIQLPTYQLEPGINTTDLQQVIASANTYVTAPITLTYNNVSKVIDQSTIVSWLAVNHSRTRNFTDTMKLEDLYRVPMTASVLLDPAAVRDYVASLAADTDQTATNAVLAMQNDALTVVKPSIDGASLDQADAIRGITAAVTRSDDRTVPLKVATTTADVNENNLAELGITDLLSEGETYFPGSPSTRLTNVRAGARRFNGVLLKPGDTFSFGALLGDVGPETGYVPELVILGDHEEKQYGGGLCQVSSTAFRAALLAGLPITERHNHAFAISYYTWPYSAPGVDATIYYPQVDFKFKNDTGHYILIQTTMSGVDLKFDFYGTKTKTGAIVPPVFISGTTDAKQPSHTVFYRNVLDLAGSIIKTDKFDTYYKPSTDFPVQTSGYN